MMIRDDADYYRLLDIQERTHRARVTKREIIFPADLARPPHPGRPSSPEEAFTLKHAVLVLVSSMLRGLMHQGKLPLKTTGQLVAAHHRELFDAWAWIERNLDAPFERAQFFGIGFTNKGKAVGAVGTPQQVTDELGRRGAKGSVALPLSYCVRVMRANAQKAEFELPEYIMPEPAELEAAE